MKWYPFDPAKGSRQKRPPIRRFVLVQLPSTEHDRPGAVIMGYRKDAAGDKQSPYFVIPGTMGIRNVVPIAWCDCLGDDFKPPSFSYSNRDMADYLERINRKL
jgi:hypothetical protein